MKDIGDLLLAYIGAGIHYGVQIVDIIHLEAVINICVGITVIIFTAIRSYFWIKNNGYIENKED